MSAGSAATSSTKTASISGAAEIRCAKALLQTQYRSQNCLLKNKNHIKGNELKNGPAAQAAGRFFTATIRGRVFPSLETSYILLCVRCTYLQYSFEFVFLIVLQAAPRSHLLIMIWCPVIRHLRVACKSACLAVSL